MNNIRTAFENGRAVVPFFVCGDPDLPTTAEAVRCAVQAGADMVELSIPFSDPTAEAPQVQAASLRALRGGVTTDRIFDFVAELRRDVAVPLVFVTYANVVYSYGAERFLARCAEIGVQGLRLPDIPFEERDEFLPLCRKYGVELICVIARTSGRRAAMIAREAGSLVYVDAAGASGQRSVLEHIRDVTDVPCIIDLGEATAEQVHDAARHADGAVAGASVATIMGRYGKAAPGHVAQLVGQMKAALR